MLAISIINCSIVSILGRKIGLSNFLEISFFKCCIDLLEGKTMATFLFLRIIFFSTSSAINDKNLSLISYIIFNIYEFSFYVSISH